MDLHGLLQGHLHVFTVYFHVHKELKTHRSSQKKNPSAVGYNITDLYFTLKNWENVQLFSSLQRFAFEDQYSATTKHKNRKEIYINDH
jgi:hypothetical protein